MVVSAQPTPDAAVPPSRRRFNNQYHSGTYFFDIHPPLGKLTLYLISLLGGYDHTKCAFANIGDAYAPDCKFMVLRAAAAAFGVATGPVLYGICRRFGVSVYASLVAAMLFVCDGLNLIESRLILIDSQLIFWCAATLLVATYWWQRWNVHWLAVEQWERATGCVLDWGNQLGFASPRIMPSEASRGESASSSRLLASLWADERVLTTRSRIAWCVVVGVVCANAVSIKFTGLASPGLVAVESFFALAFLRRAMPITDLLLIAAVSFATFAVYYALHFSLLPLSGDGDAFMHVDFQRTLVGNANYDAAAPRPGFWRMLYEVRRGLGARFVVCVEGAAALATRFRPRLSCS